MSGIRLVGVLSEIIIEGGEQDELIAWTDATWKSLGRLGRFE